jgi:hypothetical protein
MTWFQNTITRRIKARNRLWGQLFGGRYKAILIEGRLSVSGHRRPWQRDYLSGLRPSQLIRVRASLRFRFARCLPRSRRGSQPAHE